MMSKDRVEFTLTTGTQTDRNLHETARAAVRAFGFTHTAALDHLHAHRRIRCRPSQFARFIIFRVEEGVTPNGIQCLAPELVPVREESVVDVSKRPHEHA